MNKLTNVFEGQDVTVETNEGKTLINLIHTAKCCGLTNKTKEFVVRQIVFNRTAVIH